MIIIIVIAFFLLLMLYYSINTLSQQNSSHKDNKHHGTKAESSVLHITSTSSHVRIIARAVLIKHSFYRRDKCGNVRSSMQMNLVS